MPGMRLANAYVRKYICGETTGLKRGARRPRRRAIELSGGGVIRYNLTNKRRQAAARAAGRSVAIVRPGQRAVAAEARSR